MKICVTFSEPESDKAAAVIKELNKMFPFWMKTTPPKDGYIHTYLTIREPLPEGYSKKESTARKS